MRKGLQNSSLRDRPKNTSTAHRTPPTLKAPRHHKAFCDDEERCQGMAIARESEGNLTGVPKT